MNATLAGRPLDDVVSVTALREKDEKEMALSPA